MITQTVEEINRVRSKPDVINDSRSFKIFESVQIIKEVIYNNTKI